MKRTYVIFIAVMEDGETGSPHAIDPMAHGTSTKHHITLPSPAASPN